MLTPNGRISAMHSSGRTWKRHIRLEKICRLEARGIFTGAQIAAAVGITPTSLGLIKNSIEYQSKMVEVTTGVISEYDKDLRENTTNQLEELNAMVPMALLQLRNSLLSSNPTIALKATTEVLDRSGNLAKVSKVSVTHNDGPDMARINTTATDIMALLGRPVGNEIESTIDGGFTLTAAQASNQVKEMATKIDERTLEDLDLSTKKPN